jgi:hypothetical protein
MIWQRIWHSAAAHRLRWASPAFGRATWWGMLSALVVAGSTAYLLSDFADGSPAIDLSRTETGVRPFRADAQTPEPDRLAWSSPFADRWQSLPLLVSHNSNDSILDGEVEVLSLQAALERESNRADAAQREITVLQGQLARVEANEGLVAEYRFAAIEEKERTDNAMLRVAALHEELASLRASVTEAQRAVESERGKAASALEQLEVVQGQIAKRTSLGSNSSAIKGHLHGHPDESIAPYLDDRRELLPAARIFQLPMHLETYAPPPDDQGNGELRATRQEKDKRASSDKGVQVSHSPRTKVLARPVKNVATTPMRSREPRTELGVVSAPEPRREGRRQGVRPVEKTSIKASQRPRLLAQGGRGWGRSGALSLPTALLPDRRLW